AFAHFADAQTNDNTKGISMRALVTAGLVVAASIGTMSCGGNSYSSGGSGTPTSPTPPATGAGVVTINVVAINGAQSFSPNPAMLPDGQMVIWRNVDNTTHHVILNDGSVDTGNLAPGASSQPMAISSGGRQYHCSIHPVMVGSINQATQDPPPCQGSYCD